MSSTTRTGGFSEEPQATFDEPRQTPSEMFHWLGKAELEAVGRKAEAWLEANKVLVDGLPAGTYVLIAVEPGGHVSGMNRDEVRAEFHRRFGASTVSFVHRVRMPTTIGAGWWALHSGA